MGLLARGHCRILKVALPISDIDSKDASSSKQLAEAVQYRRMDQNYWS